MSSDQTNKPSNSGNPNELETNRVGWDHPIVKLAGIVPAAVVSETFGYRWEYFARACKLPKNEKCVIRRNGRYWLHVDKIAEFDPNSNKPKQAEGSKHGK